MKCEHLHHLLEADRATPSEKNTSLLAAHLRTCPRCRQGIERLSQALIRNDTLSCDQCRHMLPSYYEAIRPQYPLVEMAELEMKAILIHLSHCAECQDDYRFLAMVAEVEERDAEAGSDAE